MSEAFTDFLGHEVKVGDFVVYATTSGRSPVQKFARVEVIKTETNKYTGKPETKVGVKEISNGRGFRRWDATSFDRETHSFVPSKNGVRTTYPMMDNIVKVRDAE